MPRPRKPRFVVLVINATGEVISRIEVGTEAEANRVQRGMDTNLDHRRCYTVVREIGKPVLKRSV